MRSLWQAISILAVLHLLLLIAVAGWLYGTERINRQRLERLRDVFALTIEQEKEKKAAEEAEAQKAAEEAERLARHAGLGPQSTAQRLAQTQIRDELMLRQMERTVAEINDLRNSLKLAQDRMEKEKAELLAARREVEQRLAELQGRFDDEGFQKNIDLFERLPGKQVKEIFLDLAAKGQADQVVAYLQAMQPRKAAGVLKEFKTEQEVALAVELTERLRAQGSDLLDDDGNVG
jgi:hypothetical protein